MDFTYDNNGNTTDENTRQFIFDQNQRLIKAMDGATVLAEYIYNGKGQTRLPARQGAEKWIASENKCTVFHYNQSGLLIAESSSSGNVKSEYVYLNGSPLVKIEDGSTYYYHNDHLGTPMLMTDSSASTVWQGEYLPFGEEYSVTGSITNNIRFPGQYYDEETGLHYNYYRDYNPAIGRYVEADPIGLDGGINLYTYVGNNPVNMIDPFGLFPVISLPACDYSRYKECNKQKNSAVKWACKRYVDWACSGPKEIICCEAEKNDCLNCVEEICPRDEARQRKCYAEWVACRSKLK